MVNGTMAYFLKSYDNYALEYWYLSVIPTLHIFRFPYQAYGPGSALFPSMNPSMAAMQTAAFFNGLCGSGRPDSLKGGARSPTNLSDASERGTSSPDLSISASTALPGQVSFY